MKLFVFNLLWFTNYSEEHIEQKIAGMIKEAKTKMAKGDKKGKSSFVSAEFSTETCNNASNASEAGTS